MITNFSITNSFNITNIIQSKIIEFKFQRLGMMRIIFQWEFK